MEAEEEDDEIDEEEAWLNALEAGEVNERGYLPQRESGTLTARQVRQTIYFRMQEVVAGFAIVPLLSLVKFSRVFGQ